MSEQINFEKWAAILERLDEEKHPKRNQQLDILLQEIESLKSQLILAQQQIKLQEYRIKNLELK